MSAVVESSSPSSIQCGCGSPTPNDEFGTEEHRERKRRRERSIVLVGEEENEVSVLALFVTAFRKSLIRCYNKGEGEAEAQGSVASSNWAWAKNIKNMEIGLPSNVRHVAHVTFDRFNGFLGLPIEFEPEVSRRPPSASAKVFGVSTNSMQLSFDSRGNSVPAILVMMQRRLYTLRGLEVEGIFRITAGNAQEEYVRDELNRGVIPDDADVHCLAGLIKAWFRELPVGVLDSLSPEKLMQSQTEEECMQLARTLPLTEASLLDWAINLMADIAQYEQLNKMNPRNVAVVFAPNMTHVLDPLTALMHAVQVMNFLKTLIVRTLRERQDAVLDTDKHKEPSSESESESEPELELDDHEHLHGPQTPFHMILQAHARDDLVAQDEAEGKGPSRFLNSVNKIENMLYSNSNSNGSESDASSSRGARNPRPLRDHQKEKGTVGQLFKSGLEKEKGHRKGKYIYDKASEKNIVSRINRRSERIEAWR